MTVSDMRFKNAMWVKKEIFGTFCLGRFLRRNVGLNLYAGQDMPQMISPWLKEQISDARHAEYKRTVENKNVPFSTSVINATIIQWPLLAM